MIPQLEDFVLTLPVRSLAAMLSVLFLVATPIVARPRKASLDAPDPVMVEQVGRPLTGYPDQDLALMEGKDTVWSRYRIGRDEYFAQPNEWTCSSSCYVMMFRALTHADISLAQAVERTGAQEGTGAPNEQVKKAFEMLGSRYQVVTGEHSLSDADLAADDPALLAEKAEELRTLKGLLEQGYLVMINFREPVENVGHYGVLQGLNDRAIEIADPYYGRRSVMPLAKFDYRSGFSKPVRHGWYLAVRNLDSYKRR